MTTASLPACPCFARHYAVEAVRGEGLVLYGDGQFRIFAGPLYEDLAAAMDGRRSVADVVDALEDRFPMAETYYALLGLAHEGLLVDGGALSDADASDSSLIAFWDSLGAATGASRDTSTHAIVVESPDADTDERWSAALRAHGFTVGSTGDLALVFADDYLEPHLHAVNARALASGQPWLLCRVVSSELWIGPLFVPGHSPCWECLRHRLANSQPVRGFLARRQDRPPVAPRSAAPWTDQAAIGLIATQVARVLTHRSRHELAGVLTRIDTVTLRSTRHTVMRRPQCPACGDATLVSQRANAALELRSRPKTFTSDGGHRIVTPEVTVARLAPLVDPLTGVVSELRKIPYPSPAIHVYTSGPNGAVSHRDLSGLSAGLRRSNSGKGFTDAQARASALGEAVERYSAIVQGDEPRIRASFRDLGATAVHPSRCLHYSDRQYARSSPLTGGNTRDEWVPERFDELATIDWSPVWSLSEQRTKYLPTALAYFAYQSGDHVFGLGDSNGSAAGNTLEEAILQGFLELVERDSTAIWWYNRVQRPAVDIASLALPGWAEIREYYETIHRDLWLLDVTADLGIPCFVAVSRRRDGPREDILLGLGAHLDPQIAGSRAISELNQMLAALEALRDDATVNDTLTHWLANATMANQPYLAASAGELRHRGDFLQISSDDLLDDVRWCQRRVEERGLELLVLDQTRPDIDVPVVKVLVPDLRHFRPRFAPGRLYDVPVALEWLSHPTSESDLNPIPFFL